MATIIKRYAQTWMLINSGLLVPTADTLKLAMVTSGYTPSLLHTQWSDVSSYEVTPGDGYTAGGEALVNPVITNTTLDFDDTAWVSLTKTFRYIVCYASKTAGGLTNPLVFYILPDSTPADIIQVGSNYSININATDKLFYDPSPPS